MAEKVNKNDNQRKFDIEERLIEFTLLIYRVIELLPDNRIGNYIAGQLVKSGTSPTFNYGEAQSAESVNDFIHKMSVCLKELRETLISLKIIKRKPLIQNEIIDVALVECNELISIFVSSINTARKNN